MREDQKRALDSHLWSVVKRGQNSVIDVAAAANEWLEAHGFEPGVLAGDLNGKVVADVVEIAVVTA